MLIFLRLVYRWDSKNHTWQVTEALRPAIITLDWQRKNKTVFKSVNFAGYIGIATAVKPVCSFDHYGCLHMKLYFCIAVVFIQPLMLLQLHAVIVYDLPT